VLIYPAIDLRDGRCVRLMQGRFEEATVYDDDPFARLSRFAAEGAEWVHVVDLDGAEAGRPVQHALIERLAAKTGVNLQTGGGVRAAADVRRLLDAGVGRVVVGSAAVRASDAVRAWLAEFGPQRLCLAFDVLSARGGWDVVVNGWTESSDVSLASALALYPEGTAPHVLITDVSRDGAMSGPNLPLLAETVSLRPDLRVQASGGVARLEDLAALREIGAAGAIVGRAIYEGRITLTEALSAG
jgi:phosphoribosylformimino-5-aminoimidazole carboxamide ribotide isomerase